MSHNPPREAYMEVNGKRVRIVASALSVNGGNLLAASSHAVNDPSEYDFDENIRWFCDAMKGYPHVAWIKVTQSKFNRHDHGSYAAAKLDQNTEAFCFPAESGVDEVVRTLNANRGWPTHINKAGTKKIDFSAITRQIIGR